MFCLLLILFHRLRSRAELLTYNVIKDLVLFQCIYDRFITTVKAISYEQTDFLCRRTKTVLASLRIGEVAVTGTWEPVGWFTPTFPQFVWPFLYPHLRTYPQLVDGRLTVTFPTW